MDQQKIGAFMAACRKRKKLTQRQLVEALGVTDRSVSKTESKHTLQYYLYRMVNMSNAIKSMQQAGVSTDVKLPSETLKMAMAIVATGPVVLVYPFVQRYFVKGLTVGAVKG